MIKFTKFKPIRYNLSAYEVLQLIVEFPQNVKYDMLDNNCLHFTGNLISDFGYNDERRFIQTESGKQLELLERLKGVKGMKSVLRFFTFTKF